MASKTDYLDRVYVVSPCKMGWETMSGTEQVRYCDECSRHVHDLEKLTRRQAERLIAINRGQFCARITRRQDGVIITQEESPALHLITRRASPVAAAVVSAVISVGSAAPALAVVPRRQAQVSSVAKGREPQSSSSQTPLKPITLEPVQQQVLDVPIAQAQPALSGVIAVVPLTLRQLYEKSDLIVVGTAGRSAVSSTDGEDHAKTEYQITSVLKGKSRRQQVIVTHNGATDTNFAEGKTALLFLSKGTGENGGSRGGYVLADFMAGARVLPQTDIDIYTARIHELADIEKRRHSAGDITEWLVRCAEEPATRLDGAYELASDLEDAAEDVESVGNLPAFSLTENNNDNNSQQTGAASDRTPLKIESIRMRADSSSAEEDSDTNTHLASMLSDAQKGRLMTALIITESVTPSDLKLIELVKPWKDPRLVDFLLARLHAMEDNPPSIANELVDDLWDIVDEDGNSDVAEEFMNAPSASDATQDSEDQMTEGGAEDAEQAAKLQEAIKQRSAALKKFLAIVESRLGRQSVKEP